MTATLFTIGYEKLPPEPLVAELKSAGVKRLIDVRFRPQSRRPGMSKTRLGDRLAQDGIVYEHRRSLGTPADIRWFFKHNRIAEGRDQYRAFLESTATDELDELAHALPTDPPTALLCLEADPAVCHRRVIVEQLQLRLPDLQVTDL